MTHRHRRTIAFLGFAAIAACSRNGGSTITGALTASPPALDFGDVSVCATTEAEVTISSSSRSPHLVEVLDLPDWIVAEPARVEVPASGSAPVLLRCMPTLPGPHQASLRFIASRDLDVALPVALVALERDLSCPEEASLGKVAVSDTATVSIPVRNHTSTPLVVHAQLDQPDADFSLPEGDRLRLEGHEEGAIPVAFTPSASGERTATLTLVTCSRASSMTVALSGYGALLELRADPEELDFGLVTPGRVGARDVVLENIGDHPATLGPFRVEPQGTPFRPVTSPSVTLDPGERAPVPVLFEPRAEELYEAQLVAVMEGGQTWSIATLSGRGGGPDTVVEPESLDFGTLAVGSSAQRSITVLNRAPGTSLLVTDARIPGPMAAVFQVTPSAQLPAEVDEAGIRFQVVVRPTLPAVHAANLLIDTTDDDTPVVKVSLTARAEDVPLCNMEIRPSEIRYGLVPVNERHTRTLAFLPLSGQACRLFSVSLEGASASLFSLESVPALPATIAPANPLVIRVSYLNPSVSTEVDRASVVFTYSGEEGDGSVLLSAFAAPVTLEATPNPLDFGTSPLTARPQRTLTIRNRSAAPTLITTVSIDSHGSAPAFQLEDPPEAWPLAPEESVMLQVEFAPGTAGVHGATIEIWVETYPEPALVAVQGVALDHS
jgi:hypothetical protein